MRRVAPAGERRASPRLPALLMLLALSACKEQAGPERRRPLRSDTTPAPRSQQSLARHDRISAAALAVFEPLPLVMEREGHAAPPEQVALGQKLYLEPRLSAKGDRSCNGCHDLAHYGVRGEALSEAHTPGGLRRNAPSTVNAAGQGTQLWDGSGQRVELVVQRYVGAQGLALSGGAATEPGRDTAPASPIVARLASDAGYVAAFRSAFPESRAGVTAAAIGSAVGAFLRTLVTPSPWDRFLQGDRGALGVEAKKGFIVFVDNGCETCHAGPYLGGTSLQLVGALEPWPNREDQGAYEVSHAEGERMMFKVPSLRNVAETAPYFHDGSVATLEESVQVMSRHQLGKAFSAQDAKLLVAFMKSFTGPLPQSFASRAPAARLGAAPPRASVHGPPP